MNDNTVYNLTDKHLTRATVTLLNKGLKYIPTNPKLTHTRWEIECDDFIRELKIKAYFEDKPKTTPKEGLSRSQNT